MKAVLLSQKSLVSSSMPEDANLSWNWLDVFLVTAGAGLLILAGSVLIRWGSSYLEATGVTVSKNTTGLASALLEVISLMVSLYFLGLVRRKRSWSDLGLILPTPFWAAISVLIGLFVIPLAGWITLLIQMIFNLPNQNPQLEYLLPGEFSWGGLIASVILIGVFVPIAEEAYFRGLVYQTMRTKWRVGISLVLSSAYFGILHGDIALAGMAFILGLILGWVYERSQSLWPAIIIHMINNAVKVLAIYILIAIGIL
jgi:hypothetical protein